MSEQDFINLGLKIITLNKSEAFLVTESQSGIREYWRRIGQNLYDFPAFSFRNKLTPAATR